ncbi:MAG: VIT domain-containing protein [Ilumatobacteraceae bacterium]
MTAQFPTLTATGTEIDFDLHLSDVDVEVAVDAFGYTALVTQVFGNDHDAPIEVLYTFPLPGGVAVHGCTIRIGDRVLDAALKEIGEARMEYDEAVKKGLTASIVEKNLSEVFTVRVGNVAPNSEIEVQLTLHGEVHIDEAQATMRFPAVVAPRYSSPDAAAESADTRLLPRAPGVSASVRTRFSIEVADGTVVDGSSIRCTSHHDVGSALGHRIDDIALDRDVVWRWPVAPSTTMARWIPDTDDPEQGIVEVVIRESSAEGATRTPVDVSILIDHSGSMGGTGQAIANGIAGDILATLAVGDTADVVQFDDQVEPLAACATGPVQPGSAAFRKLIDEVTQIYSSGGTELLDAIRFAAKRLPAPAGGRERVLVLITDGHFGNEGEAVRLRSTVLKGVRIVVVGVNMAVSGGFLTELASGSYVELVNDDRRRVEVSQRICSRIAAPLHTGLQIEGATEPTRPLGVDVYPEALVRVCGRMGRPGASVTLVGSAGQRVEVPVIESADGSIRTRWAAARLIVLEHDHADDDEIVALSVRYRVLCKRTAWIVVDREGPVQDVAPVTIVQPVEESFGFGSVDLQFAYSQPVYCRSVDDDDVMFSAPRGARPMIGAMRSPAPRRPRLPLPPVPSTDIDALVDELVAALLDLRTTSAVPPELVTLVDRCRRVVSPSLRRSLSRLGIDALVGPVQQRTVNRIVRLLERVVDDLRQHTAASVEI